MVIIMKNICKSCTAVGTCKKTAKHVQACMDESNDYDDLDSTPCLEDEGYTTRSDY